MPGSPKHVYLARIVYKNVQRCPFATNAALYPKVVIDDLCKRRSRLAGSLRIEIVRLDCDLFHRAAGGHRPVPPLLISVNPEKLAVAACVQRGPPPAPRPRSG